MNAAHAARSLGAALLVACAATAAFAPFAHTAPEAPSSEAAAPRVLSTRLEGPVTPVMQDALSHALERARAHDDLLIVRLDTPGGLESSMRAMVQALLASDVPVVMWVTPAGAHAASAGVFLVMAADFAVMSPGTNIGAATPISLQGPMDSTLARKATNDAAAFARTVALQRGRNAEWAERAVREAVAIHEREAVAAHVVDFVAADEADLLAQLDGRTYRRGERVLTLQTRGAVVEHSEPGLRERLLRAIADPNTAYLLLMLGFYGLIFELQNPGAILPGIVGLISLVLACFALATLPVNGAGVALLLLGIGFLLAEIKVHSHGMLAAGGALALLLGGLLLFQPHTVQVALPTLIGCTLATVVFFLVVIGAGLRAGRQPVANTLVGHTGVALEPLMPAGRVRVAGETWNAIAEREVAPGGEVEILRREGATLYVRSRPPEA